MARSNYHARAGPRRPIGLSRAPGGRRLAQASLLGSRLSPDPSPEETASTMLTPQLVMYEDEVRRIQAVADRLQQDSRSRAILVVDKNGQLIAASGSATDLDTTSLSSLVAGNVAATGGIAKLMEEEEFTGQFHEGKGLSIHITLVGRRVILVVLFDKNTTHGLVRLRVKKAGVELESILEDVAKKAQSPQQNVFAEITDADIDNLFND
jgi:predicted regulator of Ras-like GTPase activity (Roadblock/LC7/MglB family)